MKSIMNQRDDKKVKISVIVPIYNIEDYVDRCIESLINQTYDNIQIVLIDDGSTDKSSIIAKDYYNKYPEKVTYLRKCNGGLSSARNTGIDIACGEYILFVDGDDWIEEETIETLTYIMERDRLDLCAYYRYIDSPDCADTLNNEETKFSSTTVYSGKDLFVNLMLEDSYEAAVPLHMMTKSLIVNNWMVFEEGMIHEDELFTPFLYYYAQRARKISNKLYHHCYRQSSISHASAYAKHYYGYAKVFLGLASCPGIYDSENRVHRAYLTQAKSMLQSALNYYYIMEEHSVAEKDMLKKVTAKRRELGISLNLKYRLYLVKCTIISNCKSKLNDLKSVQRSTK